MVIFRKQVLDSSAETWTLLPDNTILCAECDNHPSVEKYIISTDKWVKDKSTPVDFVQILSKEIGPAILLPDKRVFAIGATGHTVLLRCRSLQTSQVRG